MLADPVLESPGARWPIEESTTTAGGLGGGERLTPMADGSATMLEETAGIAKSLGVEVGVAGVTPTLGPEKPTVPEEQAALLEAS